MPAYFCASDKGELASIMLRIGRLGETLVAAVQLNDGTIALLTNGAAECAIRTEQPDTSGGASREIRVGDDWEQREDDYLARFPVIDDRPPRLGGEGA